jgi:hypothetical protein
MEDGRGDRQGDVLRMCLRQLHRFTFSNRQAFDRAVEILRRDHGEKQISGFVIDVIVRLEGREDMTYEELFFKWKRDDFKSKFHRIFKWDQLDDIDGQDIFGELEAE